MTGDDLKAYSPERLNEAIAEVTALAEKAGVRIALCGGLAMQSYGSPRLTKDVDIVAEATIEGLPVVRRLTFGGIQSTASNGVPVDLIVRADDYAELYEGALREAVSRPGVPCLVTAPEFLAAMKLAARRPRDLLDLHWLVTSRELDLARVRTRQIVRTFVGGRFAADEFDREVEMAEFEAAKERKVRGE
jgi:hypothetical protein